MKLQEFVRQNRTQLDEIISKAVSFVPATAGCFCHRRGTNHYHEAPKLNDSERRQWILNDEGLYSWARSEGVRI